MMKKIITIAFIAMSLVSCNNSEKTGYVKMGELFEEFELKKQLTNQLEQTVSARKNILDSLKLNLEMMVVSIQGGAVNDSLKNKFLYTKEQFLKKQEQFEGENQRLQQEYDSQIWTQLNEYVKEFGEEKKLDYIFGANGTGAIMYGNESKDVTKEMVSYVNKKYVGK